MTQKRVCIIGAGLSGLPAVKSCLEEGFEPVCFERSPGLGGVWYYSPDLDAVKICVLPSTISNTSKEMMAYSDFPFAADCPNFVTYQHFQKYVNDYADYFDLRKHIRLNSEVVRVEPLDGSALHGKWRVTVKIHGQKKWDCSAKCDMKSNRIPDESSGCEQVYCDKQGNKQSPDKEETHILNEATQYAKGGSALRKDSQNAKQTTSRQTCQTDTSRHVNQETYLGEVDLSQNTKPVSASRLKPNEASPLFGQEGFGQNVDSRDAQQWDPLDRASQIVGRKAGTPQKESHETSRKVGQESFAFDQNESSQNGKGDSSVYTMVFDALMLCTGLNSKPLAPSIKGAEKFRGQIVHSCNNRKRGADYAGKRVVVIGGGPSGVDASIDLCTMTDQVFLSIHRGRWLYSRLGHGGVPYDLNIFTRLHGFLELRLPLLYFWWCNWNFVEGWINHDLYSLTPQHRRLDQQFPMIGLDELPLRILAGKIKIKPKVSHLSETGVHFDDGTSEENIDTVILGTGYGVEDSFLDPVLSREMKRQEAGSHILHIFPVGDQCPTVAFIGYIDTSDTTIPVFELQCRWATRVWKGEIKLPNRRQLEQDIRQHKKFLSLFYSPVRHEDRITYMDRLASEVGCSPRIGKLLLTDPYLAYRLIFGAHLAYQYRLNGPHKWAGARRAIVDMWDRVVEPLKGRPVTGQVGPTKRMLLAVATRLICFIFGPAMFGT